MFDILHRVGIKASLDKVYKALATPEGVAGWWTTDTTGDRKAGGMINFRFTAAGHEIGAFSMKILELHANTRVVWQVVTGPAEWVVTRRDGLRTQAVQVAELLAAALLERGDAAGSAAVCTAALERDRYHDPLWRTLIAAREASGDQAAASSVRAAYRRTLDELDI